MQFCQLLVSVMVIYTSSVKCLDLLSKHANHSWWSCHLFITSCWCAILCRAKQSPKTGARCKLRVFVHGTFFCSVCTLNGFRNGTVWHLYICVHITCRLAGTDFCVGQVSPVFSSRCTSGESYTCGLDDWRFWKWRGPVQTYLQYGYGWSIPTWFHETNSKSLIVKIRGQICF